MKAALATVLAVLSLALPVAPAQAQAQPVQTAGIKEMLGNLWGRLRALTPRPGAGSVTTATVTAGLRGEEATESELRPYWRGDREQDPAAKNERQALESAQALADAGKFSEAARAFGAFVQDNPRSSLAANARFGGALSYAAAGDRARAAAGFEEFLKLEPQHPLADDARQALAALR